MTIAIDTRSVTHSNIENKVHLSKLDRVSCFYLV